MKAALQAYIDRFNAGDADGIAALYAENGTVEDPVGSPAKHGRKEIAEFYKGAMQVGAKLALAAPIRGSHANSAAMAFTAKAGPMTVHVIDVMTFDDKGKFATMKAYWGPEDMVQ